MPTYALTEKTIVIVGGTSGLGLSAAAACRESGANLVLVGRDAQKCQSAVQSLGGQTEFVVGDAAAPKTAQLAIDCAVEKFGQLDGLYHVAGGSGRRAGDGPLHELTDEGWRYTMESNLDGVLYSNRAAVNQFLSQGSGGSVVNMSSVLGFSPAPKFFSTHAYAAAKAAAIGLTKSCAAYYAPHNIRFNVIAPALFDTPMAKRAIGDEQIMQYVRTRQPLDGGRPGYPDDASQAAVFLLSDASKFITAQVLAVDGGWSVTG